MDLGAIVGGMSIMTDVKVLNGKNLTDLAKDKAVSSIRQFVGWKATKKVASNISNVNKNMVGMVGLGTKVFGKDAGGDFT